MFRKQFCTLLALIFLAPLTVTAQEKGGLLDGVRDRAGEMREEVVRNTQEDPEALTESEREARGDVSLEEDAANAAKAATTAGAGAIPPGSSGVEEVEASIEDIEKLISAPPSAQLGREVDEPTAPTSLFGEQERINELLGSEPRYVYLPAGGDPMIIPWVRDRVMATELLEEASNILEKNRGKWNPELLLQAKEKVVEVIERFPDTEQAKHALELREKIDRILDSRRGTEGEALPVGQEVKLPAWIRDNTRGVVFDEEHPEESAVLIGDFVVQKNSRIKSYPGITIEHIDESKVVFKYQGKLFPIPVEGR